MNFLLLMRLGLLLCASENMRYHRFLTFSTDKMSPSNLSKIIVAVSRASPSSSGVVILVLVPLDTSSLSPVTSSVLILDQFHVVQLHFRQFLVRWVIILELLLLQPGEEEEVRRLTAVLTRPPHKLTPVLVLIHGAVVENPPVVFRRPAARVMLVGNI